MSKNEVVAVRVPSVTDIATVVTPDLLTAGLNEKIQFGYVPEKLMLPTGKSEVLDEIADNDVEQVIVLSMSPTVIGRLLKVVSSRIV